MPGSFDADARERATRAEAADRMARRRRAITDAGISTDAALDGAAAVGAAIRVHAEDPVFANQVVIGLIEAGALIPRARVDAVLELLGIGDVGSVRALQIDVDYQVHIVRRRHAARPDGGHLVHEHIPIINVQEDT